MSHYTIIKNKFKEARFILAALEALNLDYEVDHEAGLRMQGWLDSARANIVVRKAVLQRQGYTAHADLGFRQDGDSYEVLMDDYDLNRYGGRTTSIEPLLQQYGVAFALDWAAEQGLDAEVIEQENGDIQVVTTAW